MHQNLRSLPRTSRLSLVALSSLSSLALAACGASEVDTAAAGEAYDSQTLADATYNFGTRAAPGKCIDVAAAGTADGTNIQQWTCNGTPAQAFRVERQSDGSVRLRNPSSNKCVDVAAAGTADGTNIQLWTCNGTPAQTFQLADLTNGDVRIVNPASKKCLDVAAAGTADGTNIQLWTCNGTPAQAFHPTPLQPGRACKRGVASNVVPGAEFSAAVGWWYNWGNQPNTASKAEFVPMIWGPSTVNAPLPAGSRYLLGFNEPNFKRQSNLTPAQAASAWGAVQARARAAGIPLVSPAVNFCGPTAADCNGQDPYQWLKDFFAACKNCQVDYIAVHWYNCDLASLQNYLEGFKQFDKPLWLTEFACLYPANTPTSGQERYMREAIPYLENNQKVSRYSWFSADPVPAARLLNTDGSPTALGRVYMSLPGSCQ